MAWANVLGEKTWHEQLWVRRCFFAVFLAAHRAGIQGRVQWPKAGRTGGVWGLRIAHVFPQQGRGKGGAPGSLPPAQQWVPN